MNKKVLFIAALSTTALLTLGAGCSATPTATTTKTDTAKTNTTTTNTTVVNTNTTTANTNVTAPTFNASASDSEIAADANGQWEATGTATTEYGTDSWSAKQATRAPNVETYGDDVSAWAPAEQNKGIETLELTYDQAVYATGVRVRESDGSGAVTKVELKDVDGNYHTVWEGVDSTKSLNYLQVTVDKTAYQANGVKITFDTTRVPTEWVEVDAVQLVGE